MKNILIKSSGDVTRDESFFDFVVKKAQKNQVVVICGGGTRISVALEEAGYIIEFDSLDRRIMKTLEERIIMKDILEKEAKTLQEKFADKNVVVVPPILYAGSVLCPINGDDLVKAYDLGFDEIYVFTKKERIEKKKMIFQEFSKVEIIGV